MRHLTDEEIQAYLDGADLDPELSGHLVTCIQCHEVLGGYRALYADLADETAFKIPQDLAGTVTSRLGLKQAGRRFRVSGDLVLVACAIVAMLIGVSVFADLGPIVEAISASAGPILDHTAPHLESSHSRLAGNGHTPAIVATCVLILVLIGFLDLVFKLKRRADIRRQMH